jgi:CMP-N-acetylneuraminic acid synthetase
MKSLAFIPARGGSKRLPGKNIMHFNGRPLIYYSIAFAQYNQLTKVIVSTDDGAIADAAHACGAEVLMRPYTLSGDKASTGSAASHCLEDQKSKGFVPDIFVTLQPTNPLRHENLFSEAMKQWDDQCDSVISVGLNKHKFGKINNGHYQALSYLTGSRSQDLEPLYYENGLIYLSKISVIEKKDVFGAKIKTILTDELSSLVDIDTEFDFKLGEQLMNANLQHFSYLM